jgi:hypothetical protein
VEGRGTKGRMREEREGRRDIEREGGRISECSVCNIRSNASEVQLVKMMCTVIRPTDQIRLHKDISAFKKRLE